MDNEWLQDGKLTIDQCIAAGSNGVYIDIDHYHDLPGISGTSLKYMEESNRHFDNRNMFKTTSQALVLGNLLHTMVLEPGEVNNRYVIQPKFGTKTETGITIIDQLKAFEAENGHKIIIKSDDYRANLKMAERVMAIAGHIINHGIKERSLFANIDGLILKARLDIETLSGDDYDVKTIMPKNGDFSEHAITRTIKQYNYHVSAGFRNIVRRALGINVGGSFLIFVSKTAGHMVKIRQIDPEWVQEGEDFVQDLLDKRRWYLATGQDTDIIKSYKINKG